MANSVVPEVHCALPSCRTLDFLPLTCPHCSSTFCRQHANPDAHACPQNPSLRTVERENLPRDGIHRDRIEVRDLLPDPKRHKARAEDAATSNPAKLALEAKQTAALAKLRASFGDKKKESGPTTSATTGPAKFKPANPALELMRLKQRAVPADPKHVKKPGDVSMVDRLFLNVSFVDADGTRRGDEKPVCVSKDVSAGKALDLFADLFKVSNVNNSIADPTKLLSLAIDQDPPIRLVLSKPLAGQIPNGGRAALLRGHAWSA